MHSIRLFTELSMNYTRLRIFVSKISIFQSTELSLTSNFVSNSSVIVDLKFEKKSSVVADWRSVIFSPSSPLLSTLQVLNRVPLQIYQISYAFPQIFQFLFFHNYSIQRISEIVFKLSKLFMKPIIKHPFQIIKSLET